MKRIFQNKTQSHEEQAKKSVKKQSKQQINITNVQRAIEDPTSEALDAETMMAIQQTHGNQFASQLTSPVQAKLTVTEANDTYEQEADAVAQQVVSRMHDPIQREEEEEFAQPKRDSLQRQEEEELMPKRDFLQRQPIEEEEEMMQPKRDVVQRFGGRGAVDEELPDAPAADNDAPAADNNARPEDNLPADDDADAPVRNNVPADDVADAPARNAPEEEENVPAMRKALQAKGEDDMMGGMAVSSDVETQIEQERGGGQALPDNVRSGLESGFGADFSNVRVHTDNTADNLSRSIQAQAFTTGSDIFFKQGSYDPNSKSGQELLAHELTHTIQQGASPTAEDTNE